MSGKTTKLNRYVNGVFPTFHRDVGYLTDCLQYKNARMEEKWRCLWCGHEFSHWNATKVMFHLNKMKGGDIIRCAGKIDSQHEQRYRHLWDYYIQNKKKKQEKNESKKRRSEQYIDTAHESYASTRKKTTGKFTMVSGTSDTKSPNDTTDSSLTQSVSARSKIGPAAITTFVQRKMPDIIDGAAEEKLTMAIADMIHSCGLPFSLASHHKFGRVLTLARNASKKYTPPGRNQVGGTLLDLNYNIYKEKMMTLLQKESDLYGLSYFGDGATVHKSPLLNILASSVHLPVACLRIADCTGHLEEGGKKDAGFIAELFLEHITEMEKVSPKSTDLVIFDGASNVQKAGRLIEATFPHASVLHGAEHVLALFYRDVFLLPPFKRLKNFNKRLYRYFGSGSMHGPYALFSSQSREHNGGRTIGLLRAADTRMAGHVISMLRTLRLKPALVSTVSSASFINGKFDVSYIRVWCM